MKGISSNPFCFSCPSGKSHKLSFSRSKNKSTRPLSVTFRDLHLLCHSMTTCNCILFIDDFLNYSWIFSFVITCSGQVSSTFLKNQKKNIQTKISILRSDREQNIYIYPQFKTYLINHDIQNYLICPHTPAKWRSWKEIPSHHRNRHNHDGTCQSFFKLSGFRRVYLINHLPIANLTKHVLWGLLFR